MPELLEEREKVRRDLVKIAEHIRRKYGWSIPRIREYLHEMLDVTV